MKKKLLLQSLIIMVLLTLIFIFTTTPVAVSDLFFDGANSSINFSDGSRQTTAATPAWHQILPAAERFELVMNNEAVLDRETGLVWQRDTSDDQYDWYSAQSYCYIINLGGRKGWRLPTIDELATLVDPIQSVPALPIGHLFTNVKSFYWSSTTYAGSTNHAWLVSFGSGDVINSLKTSSYYVRAVRSGQ